MDLTQHMKQARSRRPTSNEHATGSRQGARTSCFSFSMSLSTRCEPMKPAPPVTRIRRLAWIKQQIGTDNQDSEHANTARPRGEGDPATGSRSHLEELGEAERRGGRRWAGGVLAVAAIGLLLRHRGSRTWSAQIQSKPPVSGNKKSRTETRQDETITEFCKQRSVRGRGRARAALT